MEVETPPGKHLRIELVYREGAWEWLGLGISGLALLLWAVASWRGRERAGTTRKLVA
jgi:hypothetical protein